MSIQFSSSFIKTLLLCVLLCGSLSCRSGELETSGFIEGEEFLVAVLSPAKVEQVMAKEGQMVSKGQDLARLDSESLQIGLKNAEATLTLLNVSLEQAKSFLGRISKGLAQAGRAGPHYYSRLKEVYEAGGISRAQLNRASTLTGKAVGGGIQKDQIESLVKTIEAEKTKAEAKVAELKLLAADPVLKAPADGLVAKRFIQEGQWVESGNPAFLIVNLKEVYLKAYLLQKDLGKVKIGQIVHVKIDSFPDQWFQGELIQVSDRGEFTPREVFIKEQRTDQAYAIKIKISNPQGIFKPGMPADTRIPMETVKN